VGLTVRSARAHRLALAAIVVSISLFVVVLAVYFTRGFVPGDAIVYLAGGERLNAGHSLYALVPGDRQFAMKPPLWTVPLLSPPLIAVVFRPLAALPSDLGAYLWWIATMSAIAAVLVAYFRRRPVLASLALIVLVVPITYEVGVGNMNAFLLLGSVLIWRWTLAGRDERSGVAAALMFFAKISPVVLAWWLLTQRRWGAVRAGLVAGVVILGVSILGAGIDAHLRYLEITRETTTIGQSDLSLGGLARAIGVAPSVADLLPVAMLVGGVLGIAVLRNRPGPAFALAVATMTLGSPVVNINSYALLLGCLAPAMWASRGRTKEAPAGGGSTS